MLSANPECLKGSFVIVVDVHEMKETEVAAALTLTKKLAEFEGWADTITSDVDQVTRDVFQTTPPKFHYLVATVDDQVKGILCYYFLHYPVQGQPDICIDQLFIDQDARGHQLGTKLMDAVKQVGRDHDCRVIKRHVKPWNKKAQAFYHQQGAYRLAGLPGEY
jgi:GNAT superfamily N-acetyltransferase